MVQIAFSSAQCFDERHAKSRIIPFQLLECSFNCPILYETWNDHRRKVQLISGTAAARIQAKKQSLLLHIAPIEMQKQPSIGFEEPDPVFHWIDQIRDQMVLEYDRNVAIERLMAYVLPIANRYASFRNAPGCYDADQVALDAVCYLMTKYIADSSYSFQSTCRLRALLIKIVQGHRLDSLRHLQSQLRSQKITQDPSQTVMLFNLDIHSIQSNEPDPSTILEQQDEISSCLKRLYSPDLCRVFELWLLGLTQEETSKELGIEKRKIRSIRGKIRKILSTMHDARCTMHDARCKT